MRFFFLLAFFILLSGVFAFYFTIQDSGKNSREILSEIFPSEEEQRRQEKERKKQEEIRKFLAQFEEIDIGENQKMLEGTLLQRGVVTEYTTKYFSENKGRPPEHTGACADVIWRSFEYFGEDFQELLEVDMGKNSSVYPSSPLGDVNINFRRVRNIRIFLERNAESLTTEIIPGDFENLSQWQAGDIVTFAQMPGGLWHIAVISDKRTEEGIPYMIHNYGIGVKEAGTPLDWSTEVTGHYRWKF